MADFRARILAELDDSQIPSQLKQIGQNRKHTLQIQNIQVNTQAIVDQIQTRLNNHRFNISVGNITMPLANGNSGINNFTNNVTNQVRQASAQLTTWSNNADNTIRHMQDTLRRAKFDNDSIAFITRDLEHMDLAISNITTRINNNNLRMSIRGVDELGRTVTMIKEFDYQSGRVINVGKTIAESFDVGKTSVEAFREELNHAFSRMSNINSEILRLRKEEFKLDPSIDTEQLESVRSQLQGLITEFNEIYAVWGSHLSPIQSEQLTDDLEKANRGLDLFNSKLRDTIGKEVSTAGIESSISKVAAQYNKLESTGHSSLSQINSDITELRRLQNLLSNDATSNDELIEYYRQYETVLERVKNRLNVVSNETKGFVSLTKINRLSNDMDLWLNRNTKAASEFGGQIETLKNRLHSIDTASEDAADALQEIEQEFKDIRVQAELAGKTGKSFASTFTHAFENIARYISLAELIHMSVDVLREMGQNVYDIDSAMTDLRKVTDETADRYDSFLDSSATSAKELGRSISSLVTQTAEWSKLGFDLDESEKLAKISSVYANVADIDDSTAVSDMVTAMKAYNIESQDASVIVDSLNKISNEFAITAAGLGQGLSRSASTMAASNATLEETLALITGISEITQSPDEAGNFLKTAVARIQGMKGELEALGEEVDESVDSISKVQTQILNLTGVNIFDNAGEFRDYYEIMKDISEVVDGLKSTDRAQLYEILFGKNRMNQGAAMIQAFQSGQIQNALKAANESMGSAAAEQSRWLESLEAKTQQFVAQWQALSQAFLDSDFLKDAVDVGTGLLTVLTNIVNTINDLHAAPALISGIVTAALSFKNVGRDKTSSLLNMPTFMMFYRIR